MTTAEQSTGSYVELRRLLAAEGLLEKQRAFYARQLVIALAYSGTAIALIVVLGETWWQLLTAALLALGGMQWAFWGHDGAHRQIARSPRINDLLTIGGATVFTGFGLSWWMDSHNRHHAFPNHETLDPNADVAPFAFSRDQLAKKEGVMRVLARFQGTVWIPLQTLGVYDKEVASVLFLVHGKLRHRYLEPLATALHFGGYFALLFVFLGPVLAVAFLAVHYGLYGLFLGSTIAPNHKGMATLRGNERRDFLRTQVITSRNVRGGRLTDAWYGGLNYQIEHHLFPTMARNQLRAARAIVKPYCESHGIPYAESNPAQSYWEVTQFLRSISAGDTPAPPRSGRAEAPAPARS